MTKKFWQTKTLSDMTASEWESLCDGCGQCCLHKLDDGNEMIFSNISCHLLDTKTCQCTNYKDRKNHVPDCVQLTPRKVKTIDWLPTTCAYRLVEEGKDLPDWHHLQCGDKNKVHEVGASVGGQIVSEHDIKENILMAMERPRHQLKVIAKKQKPVIKKIVEAF